MSFFKKFIKLMSGSNKDGYKRYSSSDYYKHRHPKHHRYNGHNLYGHKHYRKKHASTFRS